MAFTVKDWKSIPEELEPLDGETVATWRARIAAYVAAHPSQVTPINEAALEDMERRLSGYTDDQVAGSGGGTPVDGSVTDVKVAANAGIAQSKISGLTSALSSEAAARASADTVLGGRVTSLESAQSGSVSIDTLTIALGDVVEDPDTGWPEERPTLDGQPIPWPLRWRSQPGSVESPVDLMAPTIDLPDVYDSVLMMPEEDA